MDQTKTQYHFSLLTCVWKMGAGIGFGELALMSNLTNTKRAASIICAEEVHVAILEKKDFTKVIKSVIEKKVDSQINFLKNFRLTEGVTRTALVKLLYYFKEKTFRRRDVVYKENEVSDGVYFIKEGEFEVR